MKLSTPDLELLITNLKAFIVKVEEDKENQEYIADDYTACVYAKTMKDEWSADKVSRLLIGKNYYNCSNYALEHTKSKLYDKANALFSSYYFIYTCLRTDGYGNRCPTKQQWLEVANKVVLKLEKKLWKRQVKAVQKSMDTDLVM